MPGCVLTKESRVAYLASAINVDLDLTGIATAFVGPTFTSSLAEGGGRGRLGRAPRRREHAARGVVTEDGWVIPTGRRARPGSTGGKPAELYRAGRMWKYGGPIRRSQPNERRRGDS